MISQEKICEMCKAEKHNCYDGADCADFMRNYINELNTRVKIYQIALEMACDEYEKCLIEFSEDCSWAKKSRFLDMAECLVMEEQNDNTN